MYSIDCDRPNYTDCLAFILVVLSWRFAQQKTLVVSSNFESFLWNWGRFPFTNRLRIPLLGFRGHFSVLKRNWFVEMMNAILGGNLLALNFAFHLLKLWTNQFFQWKVPYKNFFLYSLDCFHSPYPCDCRDWRPLFYGEPKLVGTNRLSVGTISIPIFVLLGKWYSYYKKQRLEALSNSLIDLEIEDCEQFAYSWAPGSSKFFLFTFSGTLTEAYTIGWQGLAWLMLNPCGQRHGSRS